MEGDRDRPGVGIVKTASHTHTPSLTSGTPADPRRPHSRPQQAVVQTWSCRCQTARAQNPRNLKYLRSRLCAQLPSWFKTKPFLQRSLQGSHPTFMTQTRDAFDAPLAHVHGRQPRQYASVVILSPIPWYPTGYLPYGNPSIPKANNKWSNIPPPVLPHLFPPPPPLPHPMLLLPSLFSLFLQSMSMILLVVLPRCECQRGGGGSVCGLVA
jgi:hypothetical protein